MKSRLSLPVNDPNMLNAIDHVPQLGGQQRGKNMVKLESKTQHDEEQMVFENEYID